MELFAELENEVSFKALVRKHFENAPAAFITDFPCTSTVSVENIGLAYGEYKQSIKRYALLLDSENPDHYKRSGALLHALYKSEIITKIEFTDNQAHGSLDTVASNEAVGVNYVESQEMVKFPTFYRDYYNELHSFDFALKCCSSYETERHSYDFQYLSNMCHYLAMNKELSVDSLTMIFRAFMQR